MWCLWSSCCLFNCFPPDSSTTNQFYLFTPVLAWTWWRLIQREKKIVNVECTVKRQTDTSSLFTINLITIKVSGFAKVQLQLPATISVHFAETQPAKLWSWKRNKQRTPQLQCWISDITTRNWNTFHKWTQYSFLLICFTSAGYKMS